MIYVGQVPPERKVEPVDSSSGVNNNLLKDESYEELMEVLDLDASDKDLDFDEMLNAEMAELKKQENPRKR